MAVEENVTMHLRIRTVPDQMSDVLRQLSKEFVLTDVSDEAKEGEQMLTIAPRTPPEDLPSVNVTFFASGDTSPVTPQKARSLFCNPIYAALGQKTSSHQARSTRRRGSSRVRYPPTPHDNTPARRD